MRMILLVLGVVLSFGVMGQSEVDKKEAYKRRLEIDKKATEQQIEVLALKKEISFLKKALDTKARLDTLIPSNIISTNFNYLYTSSKTNGFASYPAQLDQLLDSAYQVIDTISTQLQESKEEYQQELRELNKNHKANLDSIEIELLEQKTAYIKKMREVKSIELESVSLSDFLSTLKIEGILFIVGIITSIFVIGYRVGFKHKENAFDKEKNTLHFENLTMKKELEDIRASQKKKDY